MTDDQLLKIWIAFSAMHAYSFFHTSDTTEDMIVDVKEGSHYGDRMHVWFR